MAAIDEEYDEFEEDSTPVPNALASSRFDIPGNASTSSNTFYSNRSTPAAQSRVSESHDTHEAAVYIDPVMTLLEAHEVAFVLDDCASQIAVLGLASLSIDRKIEATEAVSAEHASIA